MRKVLVVAILMLPVLTACSSRAAKEEKARRFCSGISARWTPIPVSGDPEPISVVQRRAQLKAQYDSKCARSFGPIETAHDSMGGQVMSPGLK